MQTLFKKNVSKYDRVVSWFSCGSTSAYMSYLLSIECSRIGIPLTIAYCDTKSEHPDNIRFLDDVSNYINHKITVLSSTTYTDIWDVFSKTNYLAGIHGARCTLELKKNVRRKFEVLGKDLQCFGFSLSERKRGLTFIKNNPEVDALFPLIETRSTKQDSINWIISSGIQIPKMYRIGYKNNNCIGCVKGAKGYWNKIRVDFPDVFKRMAQEERRLNVRLNQITVNGKRKRIFLDELPKDAGNYKSEIDIDCGLGCSVDLV